jgi:putative ABC transport system ATP-binding protein
VAIGTQWHRAPVDVDPAECGSADRASKSQALDRVGILHRAGAQPGHLSGGEKQRVAIARAVAGRPALLLCDEPTGNLDTTSARAVLDLLDSLNGDRIAVVIVTHDPAVAARTQRHLAIADGVITEEQPARAGPEPTEAGRRANRAGME